MRISMWSKSLPSKSLSKILLPLVALVLVGTLAFGAAPAKAWAHTYIVQSGDTLFRIASRYGISFSQLATVNNIYDVNAIYVGQVLVLPDTSYPPVYTPPPSYVPPPVYVPPPSYYYPPGTTISTRTNYFPYIVQPGDYLGAIAARFGTTEYAIECANYLASPNLIYVGMSLAIPVTAPRYRPVYHPPVYHPAPYGGHGDGPDYGGRIYVVQPGDHLFNIASYFGTNIYRIAKANGLLNLNAIYSGEVLIIP